MGHSTSKPNVLTLLILEFGLGAAELRKRCNAAKSVLTLLILEFGLGGIWKSPTNYIWSVLTLLILEFGLGGKYQISFEYENGQVLTLLILEFGLGAHSSMFCHVDWVCLNPSYTGIWSRGSDVECVTSSSPTGVLTLLILEFGLGVQKVLNVHYKTIHRLNPSYTGIWSRGGR